MSLYHTNKITQSHQRNTWENRQIDSKMYIEAYTLWLKQFEKEATANHIWKHTIKENTQKCSMNAEITTKKINGYKIQGSETDPFIKRNLIEERLALQIHEAKITLVDRIWKMQLICREQLNWISISCYFETWNLHSLKDQKGRPNNHDRWKCS